jgi:valyl-tRNA synthetase
VFDGINRPDNDDVNYYYPTSDLVTAPDIIFFWVARMIMAGYEYRNDKPFNNVYFTGMVRDKLRRKMSKSLGNSPDPLKLIEKYGADGVRVGMLLCSPAGNDLLFDELLTEQGRNFSNKIWNTFRLIKGWKVSEHEAQTEASQAAVQWFAEKLNYSLKLIDDHFSKFRISDALMVVYTLVRDEFSGWYLEAIKPAYQHPIDSITYKQTLVFFDKILKMLHPFMPFITEEIYQLISNREHGESIMVTEMPAQGRVHHQLLHDFEDAKEIITAVRNIRQEKNIPQKDTLRLSILSDEMDYNGHFIAVIKKLANIDSVSFAGIAEEGDVTFMVKTTQYNVPLGNLIDVEGEKKKLIEELSYHQGFLISVMKKLGNENFVKNAPEKVVEMERKKKADTEDKIKALTTRLKAL